MLGYGMVALLNAAEAPELLHDVLKAEVIVQIVEIVFYVFILNAATTHLGALKSRYADWFLTTPVMLVGLMALFSYKRFEGNLFAFISQNWCSVMRMLIANFVMLSAGFLYTTGRMSFWSSQCIGFVALILAFSELHTTVSNTTDATLFWCTLALWALYGAAVHRQPAARNIWYNVLDVFSKNAVGIYVAALVLKKS
jgi:bacteriorhodopsin